MNIMTARSVYAKPAIVVLALLGYARSDLIGSLRRAQFWIKRGFLLHVLTTLFHLRVLLYLINEELLGCRHVKVGGEIRSLVYYCLLDVNLL